MKSKVFEIEVGRNAGSLEHNLAVNGLVLSDYRGVPKVYMRGEGAPRTAIA